MRLVDSKTGARVVPVPPPATKILARLSRVEGNRWVFSSMEGASAQTPQDHLGKLITYLTAMQAGSAVCMSTTS